MVNVAKYARRIKSSVGTETRLAEEIHDDLVAIFRLIQESLNKSIEGFKKRDAAILNSALTGLKLNLKGLNDLPDQIPDCKKMKLVGVDITSRLNDFVKTYNIITTGVVSWPSAMGAFQVIYTELRQGIMQSLARDLKKSQEIRAALEWAV
ncbi:hypothetical protein J4457_02700 [Candidatus Woesearchaeota archaeon]|nr:hypothetical protein [Candidatus Woesearchaeota archaeon]